MAEEQKDKKDKKDRKSFKEFDPTKYVDIEPTIDEAAGGSIVVSFGRFNPITVGHEKLANKVISEAIRRKAAAGIYMSHSQDSKKNPLSYDQKIALGKKAFGAVVKESRARTLIEVAKELSGQYNDLIIVVGQDRVREFETLMNKYNGKEYNFRKIEIVSAGERDPDADDVTGMSASKMRALASEGNFDSFKEGLPKKLKSSAKKVYDMVRGGMNITESLEERAPLTVAQRRKRGLVMKRYRSKIRAAKERAKRKMAPKEKLLKRSRKKALEFMKNRLMKNKKYAEMTPSEKIALDKRLQKISPKVIDRIAKRLFPKVRAAEKERLKSVLSKKNESINEAFENFLEAKTIKPQDPDVKAMPGSQPKGYYKGVAKDKKDDRARHFAKHSKMDDNDPAAYKPAPGDAEAKTKPSVHTKKFKQIFGESLNEASCADTRVRKRPHMALEKNGSVKFDRRFKMYRSKQDMNESYEDLNEDLVNLMLDMDSFVMSEEFDALMESNPTEALKKKAEKTGISYGILKKVYDRGVAAWRTGHRPGTTPTQWGLARVNSFATKGKGTWGKADSDLAARVRKEEVDLDEKAPGILRKMVMKHKLNKGIRKTAADRDAMIRSGKTWPEMEKEYDKSLAKRDSMKKALARLDKKEEVELDEAESPTAVHPFVHVKDPNKAAKVSPSLKHKLGIGLSMKHMLQHGIKAVDKDNDGDVDAFEKGTPDEITGTEKKNLTKVMQKKLDKEAKHTRIGHAFESVSEGAETAKVKMKIAAEKSADARKHDRMLDSAKERDKAAKERLTRDIKEGDPNPSNREDGTDSLVKVYKKDTPGQKPLKEFMLTNTYGNFAKGDRVRFKNHSMDMFDESDHEGTVIGSDVSWLRVRDDSGMLFKVRHRDANKITP